MATYLWLHLLISEGDRKPFIYYFPTKYSPYDLVFIGEFYLRDFFLGHIDRAQTGKGEDTFTLN